MKLFMQFFKIYNYYINNSLSIYIMNSSKKDLSRPLRYSIFPALKKIDIIWVYQYFLILLKI